MKLSSILPGSEQLEFVRGMEAELIKRKQKERTSLFSLTVRSYSEILNYFNVLPNPQWADQSCPFV